MTAQVRHDNVFECGKNRLLDIDSDMNGLTRELRRLRHTGVPVNFYEQLAQVKTTVADTYKWLRQAEENNAAQNPAGVLPYPSAQTIEDRVNRVWQLYVQLVNEFTGAFL